MEKEEFEKSLGEINLDWVKNKLLFYS